MLYPQHVLQGGLQEQPLVMAGHQEKGELGGGAQPGHQSWDERRGTGA